MDALSNMLQRLVYRPEHDFAETKNLRARYAGNPQMQERLAVDDRYHQGYGMAKDSPVAALASLAGSVPYDVAKLAYFNGPKPLKQALGALTEKAFPGEGFNDQTTSRPGWGQYKGMISGMMQGWRE